MAKTILITGATSGIGQAAASALAKQGHHVIVHGRSEAKAKDTVAEIKRQAPNAQVDYILGDLFNMAGVQQLAKTVIAKYSSLDVLVNNAGGIMSEERETTQEGHEKTFAINVLAPFLLTNSLLPLLQKSSDGRIVNVSSDMHKLGAKPDMNDIEIQHNYGVFTAYGNSKLYLIWNTQHLAKQLISKGIHNVTANTLHPGAVATAFGASSKVGWFYTLLVKVIRPFFKTPEQGAQTIVYLASSPDVNNVSGKYFADKKVAKVSEKYYTEANEQRLWDYCQQSTRHWSK